MPYLNRFFMPILALLLLSGTVTSVIAANVLELTDTRTRTLQSDPLWNPAGPFDHDARTMPDTSALVPVTAISPRTDLWYRFDIVNRNEQQKWFINTTNSLVQQVTVYSRNGRQLRIGQNGFKRTYPFDLTSAVPLTLATNNATTIWVNVQAPYIAETALLTLMPQKQFFSRHFNYSSMILIALGAMLALVVYNAFLYFPTRDPSFIWYAGYQLLCTFAWAVQFKVMLYCFNVGLDQSTLYFPFYIAGAASLMFAITFLRLPNSGIITYFIQAFAIALVVCGVVGLFLPIKLYYQILAGSTFAWLTVMLLLGIWRYKQGYRPARFYVAGFAIMSTVLVFILGGSLAGNSLFENQMLWALWAQLIDAVALALALADRINFLRKSRQHADKRASTDRLTGLPNRTAFERDVRAWEAGYHDGVVQEFFLTFIDVDGLKQVNDRNGHNEGDRLLTLVARWLSKQINPQHIYRIGGDEFVILSRKQMMWNLSSLHNELDNQGFPNSDLSIGSSSYSESGSRSALLKLADERMYAVKTSNR
ncbi:diguanylate cyclase [Ketobacter sp. MCCC 1A13808]|uniref:sensor domain-containing diguanylate cyclase n=1 Tax=Ketobacter sp. MCCC 1A13808 TaxID=2602738 RepID=UPI000F1EBFC9|nr:diguanylate cyclase [Ketobacter sp. MCCC 1A13808]MVF12594.1 diguanylate cyclase [Ketobacter sp. MCCC 1A13808]RLP55606.1 MAG: diguanylate cyclase [Ketobacter sp.]